MAEKCVELGLHKISLITCDHSERKSFRMDRLRKKMIAAMKQSQQPFAPELTETIIPFRKFIQLSPDNEQIIMAHIREGHPTEHLKNLPLNGDTCIMIGPEGDFSKGEIEWALSMGVKTVSLGPHRLRTETAGLAATHMQLLKMQ
jgi:16S rRNA (uracil1498-N3)-methyltransferase